MALNQVVEDKMIELAAQLSSEGKYVFAAKVFEDLLENASHKEGFSDENKMIMQGYVTQARDYLKNLDGENAMAEYRTALFMLPTLPNISPK